MMTTDWDIYGMVASSSHRRRVLAGLVGEPKGASELARDVGMRPPHISKALKELEEAGLVKCLTPGRRKGRIYALTKVGKETSSRVAHMGVPRAEELLEHRVAGALDGARTPYARNFPLRGAQFEVWPDFVIPSGSAPKVIVEVKSIPSTNPETLERIRGSAFAAANLKKKMKGVKAVLVVGGASRKDLPDLSGLTGPDHFDAVFFEEELGGLSEYIQKFVKPS